MTQSTIEELNDVIKALERRQHAVDASLREVQRELNERRQELANLKYPFIGRRVKDRKGKEYEITRVRGGSYPNFYGRAVLKNGSLHKSERSLYWVSESTFQQPTPTE